MPLSNKRKAELASKSHDKLKYGQRFVCPSCGAVHHFDSHNGCFNPRCGYKGWLEPEKKEQAK